MHCLAPKKCCHLDTTKQICTAVSARSWCKMNVKLDGNKSCVIGVAYQNNATANPLDLVVYKCTILNSTTGFSNLELILFMLIYVLLTTSAWIQYQGNLTSTLVLFVLLNFISFWFYVIAILIIVLLVSDCYGKALMLVFITVLYIFFSTLSLNVPLNSYINAYGGHSTNTNANKTVVWPLVAKLGTALLYFHLQSLVFHKTHLRESLELFSKAFVIIGFAHYVLLFFYCSWVAVK